MSPVSTSPAAAWTSWRHALLLPILACLVAACGGGDDTAAVAEPLQATPGRATAQQTGRELDLAIIGDGMFPFIDTQDRTVYSRTARLDLDLQNRLVNDEGAWLVGEPEGTRKPGELQALPAVPMTLPARATSKVRIDVNLLGCKPGPVDMQLLPLPPSPLPGPPSSSGFVQAVSGLHAARRGLERVCPVHTTPLVPATSSGDHFSSSTSIIDAAGRTRSFTLFFRGLGTHAWQIFATDNRDALISPELEVSPVGVLRFDAVTGAPDPTTTRWTTVLPARTADEAGVPLSVEIDLSGSTQFDAPFRMTAVTQDGYTAGALSQIALDVYGRIRLRYSNGQERIHGRVLLARFSGTDRMRAVGRNGWLCEQQCAGARIAVPTTQLTGQVMAGYLEPTARLREMPRVHDQEASAGTTTMPVLQRNIMATGRALDIAIGGAGVFVFVDDTNRAVYSRSGRLDVDRDGHLVHAEGWRLAGRVDLAGPDNVARALPPLSYAMPGRQTTRIDLKMNLPAGTPARNQASNFRPQDIHAYSATAGVTLYDANGAAVSLFMRFSKVAIDRWEVYASVHSNGSAWLIATLEFQPDGPLSALRSAPFDVPATSDGPNGPTLTIPQIVFDGAGITQHLAPIWLDRLGTDGHPPGQLMSVEVGEDGVIAALYDNGQRRPAGQALLARFALADRLLRVGNTGLRCVSQCRTPIVAQPGYMMLGTLVAGALEEGF